MNRDQILDVITQVLGDELSVLRDELETRVDRAVANRPLPPFVPPPVWTEGRHSASATVRHANGLFMARRDTEHEPPHEDWLPIVVGVAGLDLRMSAERTLAMRARLSDGTTYELVQNVAIPIVRGYWSPDVDYEAGDRVFRYGEFHALKPSKGIEPGSAGSEETWLKVGGKPARGATFKLDDDGTLHESGHAIGSIKPLVRELFAELAAKQRNS